MPSPWLPSRRVVSYISTSGFIAIPQMREENIYATPACLQRRKRGKGVTPINRERAQGRKDAKTQRRRGGGGRRHFLDRSLSRSVWSAASLRRSGCSA